MWKARFLLMAAGSIVGLVSAGRPSSAALVLDDPLDASPPPPQRVTVGGSFVSGGWRVDGEYDTVYWHVPVLTRGAFEYDVKGLGEDCPGGLGSKNELSHMYDWTFNNADVVYSGGYRECPFKQFIRKQCEVGKERKLELLWQILPNYLEDDTPALSWNLDTTYRFRSEWEPVGGNSVLRTYRSGVLIWTQSVAGLWNPGGLSVRIGASPRREHEGAHLGAVYSNVKVYDLTQPPDAPAITSPTSAQTMNTSVVFVQWTGAPHSQYQVRVTAGNTPDAGTVWDSGEVASSRDFAWTGTLAGPAGYYVFVRLADQSSWGSWSTGRSFTVDTSYVPPGSDLVAVKGSTIVQKSGPFNALGATYMSAMRRCKYDRTRFNSDLSFLASRGFNYVRILSMVGWYNYWDGYEIAPVSFYNQDNKFVQAWPDYWQQFRDCIDLIYDHGLRAEVTIFADAQLMPNASDRIAHMDSVLANLAGREHKVILLEVANESWQNGFPDPTGVTTVRQYGQYLADRTSLPVALSSPSDTSDAGIMAMYAGSAADIATVHFSRNIGTVEGGWLPVRDCWRTGLSGVPPMSSNEPIGPGSSVNSENDPIKLVMAAAFAWGADLPMYVYHTSAGVRGDSPFENMAGVNDFVHLNDMLPPDFSGWVRNDGKESAAPFTTYANGQANKWWTEVSSPTSGVVRNTGKIKGAEFITLPIGILSGGVEMEARRPVSLQVFNPLTGQVVYDLTKNAGERFTLAQGPRAYILKGVFTDVPNPGPVCFSDQFAYPDGDLDGNGGWSGSAGGGIQVVSEAVRINGGPTSADCSHSMYCMDPGTGHIRVSVKIKSGAGSSTMWGLWFDDPSGANLARWYGSGTTVRGRIGGTADVTLTQTLTGGWDRLLVMIDPAANTSEFFFNGVSLGTLNHGVTGATDVLGRVLFERIGNEGTEGNYVDFDDLVVGQPHIPGDLDDDEDVDQVDFGALQACFSGNGQAYGALCAGADLDQDGDVDQNDLAVFAACLGGSNTPSPCE